MSTLLSHYDLRGLPLPNRIVMGPMTRSRAPSRGLPTALMTEYYAQRASAGLIVTEATNVGPASAAFELTPGLVTDEQAAGWKQVTDAVHANGGRIFAQLWHGGRVSSLTLLGGAAPLSPSGVNDDLEQLQVWAQLQNGYYTKIHATPSRAMTTDEVAATVEEFRQAALRAKAAGFDGVEIHAANGYLPHQFLSSTLNRRDDRYGGSLANRARFLEEIVDAVGGVLPLDRVGVRISPYAKYNNVRDADPDATYAYVGRMLDEAGVAYVHAADTNGWSGEPDLPRIIANTRDAYRGTLIVNGGIAPDAANALIDAGDADLVAFARAYIANPDLVERIAANAPLAAPKTVGWYGGDRAGYVDYARHDAAGLTA
ncbi:MULTISPECIES: alkene reductase [unclassified Burkholderia]|uniref:alkene reductase n=1 Tax=unclassified Burkholderia TaxID=2613784 RepID=UPI000755DCE5|nr:MULTISPECIES: alkene reductase [unclassified Burkholderia]KUY93018.1 alkene reductase [Burkholderia sp. RF7-non_BP4]KUY95688.1 alkene reductase [Burkholderia sp. RF7-non_BP1]